MTGLLGRLRRGGYELMKLSHGSGWGEKWARGCGRLELAPRFLKLFEDLTKGEGRDVD